MGDESTTSQRESYFDCNRPLLDEFDKIYEDYRKDCDVNYANLADKVMAVPAIKHKWVTRLCIYRNKLYEAKRLMSRIVDAASEEYRKESKVEVSSVTAKKEAEKSPKVKAVRERVELLERMVEVMSEINGHMRYFNNEIASIIEWNKMETT